MRAIGITEFLNKSFDVYEFTGEWLDSFGEPEKNFIMVLYGDSGNGKTVRNFKVYPKSRFGGNKPFVIWDKQTKQIQQTLFDNGND